MLAYIAYVLYKNYTVIIILFW